MDKIDNLLTRGVDKIYPSREALEKILRSGKKLRLYQGFDPTGTMLHIGHAVGFRKLRQFQDLGHHVIFLIGDGTGLAGDPSGKMKARGRFMSRQELRDNAKSYLLQSSKIVRFDGENPVEIKYNGDWLTKLQLEEILNIAQNFSLQQMIERDMYQERMKIGDTINLREFMYPLLQGYDSVAMKVDLEVGGSDQTFNMLAGRTLVKAMLGKEKYVLTTPLLTDASGNKIGKTEGNIIGLTDAPDEFYGKIMSLGDNAIVNCFTLLTDKSLEEIKLVEEKMKQGENPMIFKKQLAYELTKQFNNDQAAKAAQEYFSKTFQQHNLSGVKEFAIKELKSNPIAIVDLLANTQCVTSKSEAKRLVEQSAVEIDQTVIDIIHTNVTIKHGMTLRVGKKKFLRFI
jgi:tyrosyl-tRNA synthetase